MENTIFGTYTPKKPDQQLKVSHLLNFRICSPHVYIHYLKNEASILWRDTNDLSQFLHSINVSVCRQKI